MNQNTIAGTFGRTITLLLLVAVFFAPLPKTHADPATKIVEALPYTHDEQEYAGVFETGNSDAALDATELSTLTGPVIFRTAIAINYDALPSFGVDEDDLPSFPAWGGLLYQFKINLREYSALLILDTDTSTSADANSNAGLDTNTTTNDDTNPNAATAINTDSDNNPDAETKANTNTTTNADADTNPAAATNTGTTPLDYDMRSKREAGIFEHERDGDYLLVTALIPGDYASQHGGEFALYLNGEKVLAIAPRSMGMDELLIVHPAGANLYQMPLPRPEERISPAAGDAPLLRNEYCQGGELIRTLYQDLNGDGRYHGPDDGELLSYEVIGSGTDLCPAGSSSAVNAGGESSSNQPGTESPAPGDGVDPCEFGCIGESGTRDPNEECRTNPRIPCIRE